MVSPEIMEEVFKFLGVEVSSDSPVAALSYVSVVNKILSELGYEEVTVEARLKTEETFGPIRERFVLSQRWTPYIVKVNGNN